MCTVSFIASHNKQIITSNRDENTLRPKAFQPKKELINNCNVVYPKDPKAGGTWFAINEYNMAAVLLNGAFQKHIPEKSYSKSRGLILLEIITNPTPVFHFSLMSLETIEPFTLILFQYPLLLELRWYGKQKFKKQLDATQNYIWASSTLYSQEVIAKREKSFYDFIKTENNLDENSIVNFHSNNHNDNQNGIIINRENKMKTFSITQAIFEIEHTLLTHFDLFENSKETISITQNTSNFQLQ